MIYKKFTIQEQISISPQSKDLIIEEPGSIRPIRSVNQNYCCSISKSYAPQLMLKPLIITLEMTILSIASAENG